MTASDDAKGSAMTSPWQPIITAQQAEIERLTAIVDALQTPHGVHLNMLHGRIAKLTWEQCKHLHRDVSDAELAELRAEIERLELRV